MALTLADRKKSTHTANDAQAWAEPLMATPAVDAHSFGAAPATEDDALDQSLVEALAAALDFDNEPFDLSDFHRGAEEFSEFCERVFGALADRNEGVASDGADVVALNGYDEALALGDGDDAIYVTSRREFDSQHSEVLVDGGTGEDTLHLWRPDIGRVRAEGFSVTLGASNNFGDNGGQVRLVSIEHVEGSGGKDTIIGDEAANRLAGRFGDDTLSGRGGDDALSGEAGNDTLGGDGGDDRLDGGDGDDTLTGGAGVDRLLGGIGNDGLEGGQDDDQLSGGDGDDRLTGGSGADQLSGGAGKDVFVFAALSDSKASGGSDLIADFSLADDRIDLSAILSDEQSVAPFLDYIGTTAFSGVKGEVRFETIDAAGTADDRTRVELDDDGDGEADLAFDLAGLIILTQGQFDLI